jgi:hypothetical protein
MDYFRGYRTFRDDPEWTGKALIGAVLALAGAFIPIVPGIVLQGWSTMVLRRSVHGIDAPMPRLDFDFDYLGKLLSTGFKGFLVRLLWTLPVGMLAGVSFICLYFGVFAAVLGGAQSGNQEGVIVALVCIGASVLVLIPLLIVLTLPAAVASLRAELTDDLQEGLKFGEVIAMTKLVFKELFIGSLLVGFAQGALFIVGMLLCYFPLFGVIWLGSYVGGMFQAELYRAYLAKGGTPFPQIAPPDLVPAPGAAHAPQQPGGW